MFVVKVASQGSVIVYSCIWLDITTFCAVCLEQPNGNLITLACVFALVHHTDNMGNARSLLHRLGHSFISVLVLTCYIIIM